MTAISGTIRVGTRGSLLARTQTEWVVAALRRAHPRLEITTEIIRTVGDVRQDVAFAKVGAKGMFVREIEEALQDGAIDLAVHSLKDMPADFPVGLALVCVPRREEPLDALISRTGACLADLDTGAIVGTSSARRQAQLRHYRNDLRLVELRGNLDTRIRKLDSGEYDAIVLAAAGLNRLGLAGRIAEHLSPEICVPAVGQGALALEARSDDERLSQIVACLHDPAAALCVEAERGFQRTLGGGCSVPAGALAELSPDSITVVAMVAAPDGSIILRATESGPREAPEAPGIAAAERLLAQGAEAFLKG